MLRRLIMAQPSTPTDPLATSVLAKLTSWWEMSEASGARNDSKGTNHLSVVGTVSTATGVRGGSDVAASFAGAGGLTATSTTSLNIGSIFGESTHCMFGWVYLTSNSGSQYFFSKWDNSTTTSSSIAYLGCLQSGNYNAFNGGSSAVSAVQSPPSAGAWHFYVMWRDPADGKVRMQIDNGTIAVSASVSNPAGNTYPLYFGRDQANVARVTGRLQRWGWIKGAILTADERTYLYNSGSGRTYAEIVAAA